MKAFVIKTYPAKKISPRLGRDPLGDLAMEVVEGIFARSGYETDQLRVQVASREPLMTDIDLTEFQPTEGDIFSFSCHVRNMTDSAVVADYLGRRYPESTVLMGGPNLNRFTCGEILSDFPGIDYALSGLAEFNLPQFLTALEDREFNHVRGLY